MVTAIWPPRELSPALLRLGSNALLTSGLGALAVLAIHKTSRINGIGEKTCRPETPGRTNCPSGRPLSKRYRSNQNVIAAIWENPYLLN
jgi:hypothetical protein